LEQWRIFLDGGIRYRFELMAGFFNQFDQIRNYTLKIQNDYYEKSFYAAQCNSTELCDH